MWAVIAQLLCNLFLSILCKSDFKTTMVVGKGHSSFKLSRMGTSIYNWTEYVIRKGEILINSFVLNFKLLVTEQLHR